MDLREVFDVLAAWTPYLAGGFAWNVAISVASMLLGTVVGGGLALARLSALRGLRATGRGVTELSRNIPTFVCLFYLAFLLPAEMPLGGGLALPLPPWVKASLALAVAVVGYVSDTLVSAILDRRRGRPEAMLLILPSWMTYFLIIVMASSTASIIGVSEIVSRANLVINATGRQDLMVWIYLYAMLWFLLFCWPLTLLMRAVQRGISRRAVLSAPTAEGTVPRPRLSAPAPSPAGRTPRRGIPP